jgi:peptidyl-prolyl cis-trans isomerase-like 6
LIFIFQKKLFQNILPKTCENFRLLCTGEKGRAASTSTKLSYKGSILHRIVPQGWIQGGDIVSGKGNGSESVYGGLFEGNKILN